MQKLFTPFMRISFVLLLLKTGFFQRTGSN